MYFCSYERQKCMSLLPRSFVESLIEKELGAMGSVIKNIWKLNIAIKDVQEKGVDPKTAIPQDPNDVENRQKCQSCGVVHNINQVSCLFAKEWVDLQTYLEIKH